MKKKESRIDAMNEEQKEIFQFIIIVIVIGLIVGIIYLISYFASMKNEYHYNDATEAGEINDSIVTVGTMFNRPEKEYYVVIYKDDATEAVYYSSLVNKYKGEEDALNVYYCNLNNKLNEAYYAGDEKSNPKAKTIDDLKVGDFTFVKIKDGKITKYIEDVDAMKEELGI